ncbi:Regulator_of chromosome condensation 1/beta-lactamase-inhibitor protein II [Hexamita inflata]|uniref:Regulator of chromosome condensation 1/beta-lactamase-inhibitor protein II n=1 Tax=Hexamita inflata TaxID=28002 RepID=A0AA86PKT7_9EUKA|nr:Regulator of chromosome condensation 1/beta-lactamase-inhibitor protein II [Hexamita inflata]
MLFIISLQNIVEFSYSPSLKLRLGYLERENRAYIDFVECGKLVYAILSNGSLVARGESEVLFSAKYQIQFKYINIDNTRYLYCESDLLTYLANDGNLYSQVQNQFKFEKVISYNIPTNIKQMAFDDQQLLLTTNGIYIKGDCGDSHFCGQLGLGEYDYYTQLILDNIDATQILKLEYEDELNRFIFIYMKNGDVYALGTNDDGVLPLIAADSVYQRLVGNGYQKILLGFNLTEFSDVSYYIKNNNFYQYVKNTKQQHLLYTNVLDFYIDDSDEDYLTIYILTNTSLVHIFEYQETNSKLDFFCFKSPLDPNCVKRQNKLQVACYDENQNVLQNEFCKVFDCVSPLTGVWQNDCQADSCQKDNITCLALYCRNHCTKECYNIYDKEILEEKIENGQDYMLMRNFLVQTKIHLIETETVKLSAGASAGIAVAICFVVFIIIIVIVFAVSKRKQAKQVQIAETQSAETNIMCATNITQKE